MSEQPRWLASSLAFQHRHDVEAVLCEGGALRPDGRVLLADHLVGTYKIRLNIAKDPNLNPGDKQLIEDIERLVIGLEARAGSEIAAWFVRDLNGVIRYWVFEDRASGEVVACLKFQHSLDIEQHAV